MVGSAGFVCGEGGDGDVVYERKLSDGVGEEEGGGAGAGAEVNEEISMYV